MQEQLKAYEAVHEVIIANKQHLNVSDFWAVEEKIQRLKRSLEWNMALDLLYLFLLWNIHVW